jgi:hypothetical protein
MAGLTKQHFEEIAEIVKGNTLFDDGDIKTLTIPDVRDLVEDLSNYFKTQNPLFNENQFKKACLE